MDKFEKQFEDLDVQSQAMDDAMSSTTTLTVPQVSKKLIDAVLSLNVMYWPLHYDCFTL